VSRGGGAPPDAVCNREGAAEVAMSR
jgi:hypothetical protein